MLEFLNFFIKPKKPTEGQPGWKEIDTPELETHRNNFHAENGRYYLNRFTIEAVSTARELNLEQEFTTWNGDDARRHFANLCEEHHVVESFGCPLYIPIGIKNTGDAISSHPLEELLHERKYQNLITIAFLSLGAPLTTKKLITPKDLIPFLGKRYLHRAVDSTEIVETTLTSQQLTPEEVRDLVGDSVYESYLGLSYKTHKEQAMRRHLESTLKGA
jgi:hypothetical protein